jgi:anti-anti-sigma factor
MMKDLPAPAHPAPRDISTTGRFAGSPTISIDLTAKAAVIEVRGALDIMSSQLFADAIDVAGAGSVVVVSFEACPSLDSTILSVLVRYARAMRRRLVLLAPKGGCVRRLLDMCGLDDMLQIVSSPSECVALR